MRVVIADDMEDTRNGIQKLIAMRFPNFTIEGVFEDGNMLMEYLEHHVPDLLITDIRMPGYDGLAACKKLREHSEHAKIILITAYQDFEYAKQAIRYRVHDLITKPYTREQLANSISAVTSTPENLLHTEEIVSESRSQLFVRKAKEYIHANYTDMNLSTSMIADYLQITPNYLGDVFYRECGYKLTFYIRKIRIEEAKKLLHDNKFSIHEISTQIGVTNVQSFNRLFKNEVGMTPTDYRTRKLLQ